MAFSYSDKNFTVVGNLCFVHIILDGTKGFFNIPPAIVDRMLPDRYVYMYPYIPVGTKTPEIGFVVMENGGIIISGAGKGYLSFYFHIDSNK